MKVKDYIRIFILIILTATMLISCNNDTNKEDVDNAVTNMYDATVSVIDNANNKVIATIPVDKGPSGITLK